MARTGSPRSSNSSTTARPTAPEAPSTVCKLECGINYDFTLKLYGCMASVHLFAVKSRKALVNHLKTKMKREEGQVKRLFF